MAAITLKTNFATGDTIQAADFNTNFVNIATFVDALQAGTNFNANAITTGSINDGAITESKLSNNAVSLAKLAAAVAQALVPSGAITAYGGAAAPSGYLLCDGSLVSRTVYSALFTAIGTNYGAGDGSTTFALPNLKGRVAVGFDSTQVEFDAFTDNVGVKTVTLTSAEMPSHSHTTSSRTWTQSTGSGTLTDPGHIHTGSTDFTNAAHTHSFQVKQKSDAAMTHNGSTTLAAGGTNATSEITLNTSAATAGIDHNHTLNMASAVTGITVASVTVTGSFTLTVDNTGGGGAHNNLQPYTVVNYIIKT